MDARLDNAPAQRVLAAADDLFYRQGYTATGVNQIIGEAGVARASFYQYFPSKEKLAVAYLQRRHQAWMERLHAFMARQAGAAHPVDALFDFLAEWLASVDYRGCAFLNMASETPALGSEVQTIIARHKAGLRAYVRDLVERSAGQPWEGLYAFAVT